MELLYLARFLAGVSAGGAMVCCPMYNIEISNKDNRGILGSFYTIFLCIGKVHKALDFVLNKLIPNTNFRDVSYTGNFSRT